MGGESLIKEFPLPGRRASPEDRKSLESGPGGLEIRGFGYSSQGGAVERGCSGWG